jgi:hypothetical protein
MLEEAAATLMLGIGFTLSATVDVPEQLLLAAATV